ncbi:MAG: hypothetical protein R2705_16905 [Ilumatobacteraceae bacterium]
MSAGSPGRPESSLAAPAMTPPARSSLADVIERHVHLIDPDLATRAA